MAEEEKVNLKPQDGPQTDFLASSADIAIYGGAAGGGKSYALLLEPIRHYNNKNFGAVIFRRNAVQVRNEGGLWDESEDIYPLLNATPHEHTLEWDFPSGASVKFSHLEYDRTIFNYQGAQIPMIGFDELTHFSEKQFWYMFSRNRSTSGVPGYIRATTNPDAESWVRRLIDWWIGNDGYPIPERSGVLRWFVRLGEEIHWADSRKELIEQFGDEAMPKSITFIPSKIEDNKILMEKDPSYLANLKALPRVDRLRLLGGNWDVKPTAGMFFKRDWFEVVDSIPSKIVRTVRGWDKAATKPNENNPDPDWTRGVKIHKLQDGTFLVSHVASAREAPLGVERLVKNTASQDGLSTEISLAQDPGSAGKSDIDNYTRLLAGYIIHTTRPSKHKVTRAKPFSAQCEAGNVRVLRGDWNEDFFWELENFDGTDDGHDDQVDAAADAFNVLCSDPSILNVL